MTNKKIAEDFLKLAAAGHSYEAFQLYTGKNFRHHNAYFKGDAEKLMRAMEESAKTNPNKILTIHHVLKDGDKVAVHSHVRQNTADLGAAVVHIFRFESDKIVELWNLGQPVPNNMINENGMF